MTMVGLVIPEGFRILNGCPCEVLCRCCCPAVRSVAVVVADCLALSRTRLGVGWVKQ